MPCAPSAARCAGTSRRARMPPWTFGCSVFTRPSSISGKPVTSATSTHRHPGVAQQLGGAAGGEDLHAEPGQAPRELHHPGLVVHARSARAVPSSSRPPASRRLAALDAQAAPRRTGGSPPGRAGAPRPGCGRPASPRCRPGSHRHRRLQHDGAAVHALVHEVHGGARDLAPRGPAPAAARAGRGTPGSSEGWMLRIRPAKCPTKPGDRIRMKPARHTSPTPRAFSSCTSAASNAFRGRAKIFRVRSTSASMPAARARSERRRARTVGDHAPTTAAGKPGRAQASRSAWRFEPRPETSTPTAAAHTESSCGPPEDDDQRHDAAPRRARPRRSRRSRARLAGGRQRRRHLALLADGTTSSSRAHVEGPEHLGVVDRGRRAGAPRTPAAPARRRGRTERAAALGQHARQVLGDAAAGDVRHRVHARRGRAAPART